MSNSLSQTASLTCPQCEQPFDAAIWLMVDASEHPDLLPRLRAGTLHDTPCPHCGHEGEVDAPVLLYRPGETPPLLFSPAQQTSQEQDQAQAVGLLRVLHEALGDAWQDGWLEEMPVVPRPLLPAALSDDPETALQQMAAQVEQELERLRQENPQAYAELEAVAQQMADGEDEEDEQAMPPLLAAIQQFIQADTWMESYRFVQAHPELLADESLTLLETLVNGAQQAGDDNARRVIAEHLALLRRCREVGVTEAFAEKLETTVAQLEAASSQIVPEQAQALADSLIAWIQTPDWAASEAYLQQHAATLLTNEAEAVLELLRRGNPDNTAIPEHQTLLKRSREMGITAMYAALRRQRQQANMKKVFEQAGGLGQAIWRFLQADAVAAEALLLNEAATLLILDAGQMMDALIAVAREAGNTQQADQWQERRRLWETAYHVRVGGPRHSPAVSDAAHAQPEGWTAQPENWREQVERQPVQAERGTQYTVISAVNSAIGDNALVINNIGVLPLRWRRPAEGRPRLARAAVGRETELAELHQRLLVEQNAAVVGQGTSAALRGQPAIGKTTLAAMYADRFGSQYPGGVLWLEVGPALRTAVSVLPLLQRMATYAYDRDVQAEKLLENSVFAADRVKSLLSGHGEMLAVMDDVWDPAALRGLQDALPDDAVILLTTRDNRVAFALANSPTAVQQLTVLSASDARVLLQRGAPGLPDELADRVAKGLGYHAYALTLAAAALHTRKTHRYEQTAADLLGRVTAGQGFGDLPLMDQTERVSELETALKYSYDYLGEGEQGESWQARFRGLGALAPETDFDTAVAAAIWDVSTAEAEEFLLLLDGLGLLQEAGLAGRWQQHAILRAYALGLQPAAERVAYAERHSDYYLNLSRQSQQSVPRDNERVEMEFGQISHAFDWCETNSPRRATQFTHILNDFMRNRGRVPLLNQWLQTALHGAELHGDRLGKANTLQSLGDLERRLGNVEQARRHYDAALPLYEAEQARLGKANTLQSLGDLESRLGNVEQARRHYDAAQQLFELEQDPMGRMNVWVGLARLEADGGNIEQARQLFEKVFALAEDLGFDKHPVTLNLRQEYAQLGITPPPSDELVAARALADLLAAWIETPDWRQSQAFLEENEALLLTEQAEAVLALLQQGNPDSQAIPQHRVLLRRCREVGIAPAYQEMQAATTAAQDPTALALAALLQAGSAEALQAAIAQHATLLELSTLEQLAGLFQGAPEADQREAAHHLLVRLTFLLHQYNHTHATSPDFDEQSRFVALLEGLLAPAATLDVDVAAGLRQTLGWALNTLGNAQAEQGDHAAAVATYGRAIAHAPDNAMLYRNRAGEHLEMGQVAAAAADIERAAQLEPEAPRLAQLRRALAEKTDVPD
ncbi:MAG: tetratricopeptide repeat protein [Ardenticatenaceae bacterium]|nr:tetratricopeptide repeat protein [Ardenticatenaceae bacterium]